VWKHRKTRGDTTTEPGFDYEACMEISTSEIALFLASFGERVQAVYSRSFITCIPFTPLVEALT
jgi:hypothetical protein